MPIKASTLLFDDGGGALASASQLQNRAPLTASCDAIFYP